MANDQVGDVGYNDLRYVNVTGDNMSGSLFVSNTLASSNYYLINVEDNSHVQFAYLNTAGDGLYLLPDGAQQIMVGSYSLLSDSGDIFVDRLTNALKAVNGSIIPAAHNTYDLGTDSVRWRDIYVQPGTIYMGDNALRMTNGEIYTVFEGNTNFIASTSGDISFENITIGTTNKNALIHIVGTNDTEDVYQGNGVLVDGPTNVDKGYAIAEDGEVLWEDYIYRDEGGKYRYTYNYRSGADILVMSESGRVGINKHSNIIRYHNWFDGIGNDDMIVEGVYNANKQRAFRITVLTTNAVADTFRVESTDDMTTFQTNLVSGTMSSTGTNIGFGITLTWGSVTGHMTNDKWWVGGYAQLPLASLSVAPREIAEFQIKTNLLIESYRDASYEISTKELGETVLLSSGTNSAFYVGMPTPVSSLYFYLSTNAAGANLVFEYWNGAGWQQINYADNFFSDTTLNFTQSGDVNWDTSTMTDWSRTNLTVSDYIDEYYWLRVYSTNSITTRPVAYSVSAHGRMRFAVMSSYGDGFPALRVEGDGTTYINSHPMTESILRSFSQKMLVSFGTTWTQSLANGVTTKLLFSNELSDISNRWDPTNSIWRPNDTAMHRLNLSLKLDDLDAGEIWQVYLYENGSLFATIHDFISRDNNDSPQANITYVFEPTNATNYYEVYVYQNGGSTAYLINGYRANRLFGEKIQ